MRILFISSLVSGKTSGLGGHYNSVRDLRAALGRAWPEAKIEVLAIGNVLPAAFQSAEDGIHYINSAEKSLLALVRSTLEIAEKLRPTHVHAFDNKSYVFARLIAHRVKAKKYLTRPGGPNPKAYFPAAPDIICFSAENQRFLARRRKHGSARIHLLPQRVIEPDWDNVRIAALHEYARGRPILLRIARITRLNEPSLRQAIALSRILSASEVEHSLLIIGSPNDATLVAQLTTDLGEHDHLITAENFTVKAERLTRVAQAVVGSGRTLIEAALSGAVLYSPLAGSELPTLVTESNWRQLAEKNFSARSTLEPGLITSREEMVQAFVDRSNAVGVEIADELQVSSSVCEAYLEIYDAEQELRSHPVDFALNWATFLVPYAKVWWSIRRRKLF